MKIFNSIIKTTSAVMLLFAVSCQPEDVTINTGPVYLGEFEVTGTSAVTGAPVTVAIADNVSNIPLNGVFTVNFSKPLDPSSAEAITVSQEGTPVPASVSINGTEVTIDPNADLQFGLRYTITLDNGIRAQDGGVILQPISRTFTAETEAPNVFDGETFHMAFEGNNEEELSGTNATVVGTPTFGSGLKGQAYKGATDSYLTFPTTGLLSTSFSATFWMKVDGTPDRAGVLVIGPPDPNNPTTPNNRNSGFRLFRENVGGNQRFKLNVGTGAADSWFDGGATADVVPNTGKWTHFAISISPTQATVFIDGKVVVSNPLASPISWTGTDIVSIMSGSPRFTEWGHLSDLSLMDELHFYGKALDQNAVKAIMAEERRYDGEIFQLAFDGDYKEAFTQTDATVVGTPGFAGEAVMGSDAYEGATGAYLTFPTDGLKNDAFSAAFWLKVNAVPDRAGILVMGPPDPNNPTTPNNRNSGFRFFREGSATTQRFKLNVGNGTADSWFDGGAAADVDVTAGDWVHFAFTISDTKCVVYINGAVVKQDVFTGVDWTGCDVLSIMSGAPRFTEWNHLSDLSYMDQLHIFDKELSEAEIDAIIANEDPN
jgi:hypothetical protein